MIRNYYTLTHIVNELNNLGGWVVAESFSQDKDSLVISLNDGKRESFIVFVCDGKYDSIYLKQNYGKARKNTTNLLTDLEGDIFQSAELVGKSRIIRLNFLHTTCYAVLFGGLHSNFFLVSGDGIIFDSFKNQQVNSGSIFVPNEDIHKHFTEFPPETPVKNALSNSDLLFGSTYTNEILSRIKSISGTTLISELLPEQINLIQSESEKFIDELLNSDKFYVLEDSKFRKIMSPVALAGFEIKSVHNSCSEAVGRKFVSDIIDTEFRIEFRKIQTYLDKQKHKIDKQLENMSDIESAYRREKEYRKSAELLMSQPDNKSKSGSIIKLTDWDGIEYEIKLDPKLKLIDNAKKYFDKARATLEDIKMRKIRIPDMLEKQKSVNEKISELNKVRHIKELSKFETGIKQVTGQRVNTSKMTMEDKFRKFELGEGFVLYAGKNASNNDELTMKFAKPNDVWLHARGSSGSHTIIRMDKEEKPPKQVLQKAAEITAYYSGARNAKYVPVIWTFKKYVRKPKGANVGAVIVAKETVIMAEPKLPEGEKW